MSNEKNLGSTETRTRIAGFRVLSANHYTIEPPEGHCSASVLASLSTENVLHIERPMQLHGHTIISLLSLATAAKHWIHTYNSTR